jgi:hypothetical protein
VLRPARVSELGAETGEHAALSRRFWCGQPARDQNNSNHNNSQHTLQANKKAPLIF